MDHNVEFLSNELLENSLSLDELLIKRKSSTYFHGYQGKSMFPYLRSGDILIVDASVTPKHGSLIVCFLDGERLVRWLWKTPRPQLVPDNKKFQCLPIREEFQFEVFGTVIAIIRQREQQI